MTCTRARNVLYPLPSQAAVTIETPEAISHLRQCPECQDYFSVQADWSCIIREKAGTVQAPPSLRDRITREIEQTHTSAVPSLPSRRSGFWMGTAAASALFVITAGWFFDRLPSERFFSHVCEDHAHYLDGRAQVQTGDPALVEAFFHDKTDFGVRVPALDGAQLLGGRLCFLKQTRAALVFYRQHGRPVSLFQFRRNVSLSALHRTVIDGVQLWRASFGGYSMVAFEQRGVTSVLVSDLRESELLPLASAARLVSQER